MSGAAKKVTKSRKSCYGGEKNRHVGYNSDGHKYIVSEFRQLIYYANPIGLYVQEHQRIVNARRLLWNIRLLSFGSSVIENVPRCGLVQLLCCTVVCWTENAFKGLTFW